jgi:small subunit ribosomal protein S17
MADETPETENPMAEDAVSENDKALAEAKAAAADAEQALEAIQAEAARELPADDVEAAVPVPGADEEAAPAPATEPADTGARLNRRKVREGIVVSDAMASTIVVAVVDRVRHPKYGKTVQRTKKLYVHDAEDTAKRGDRVRVAETRPFSKLKRWRLTEVVERAR